MNKKTALGIVTTAVSIGTIVLVSGQAQANTNTTKLHTITTATKSTNTTNKITTKTNTVKPVTVIPATSKATSTMQKPKATVKSVATKAPTTSKSVPVKTPVKQPNATTKAPITPVKKPNATTKTPTTPVKKPSPTTTISTTPAKVPSTTTKAPITPVKKPNATSKTPTTPVKKPSPTTIISTTPAKVPSTTTKAPTTPTKQPNPTTTTPVSPSETIGKVPTNQSTMVTTPVLGTIGGTTNTTLDIPVETRKPDYYSSMTELYQDTKEGIDWKKDTRDVGNPVLIVAPHGGNIEQGTTELTKLVANNGNFDYFSFEAIRPSNNTQLHVTSTHYDDETLHEMIQDRVATISIHGAQGDDPIVYLGGYKSTLRDEIERQLESKGFIVKVPPEYIGGANGNNFINKIEGNTGIQLELTTALRKAFFKDGNSSTTARKNTDNWTSTMYDFAQALNDAIGKIYPGN
ncbi:poly-gamma-glutamate hydrolase family protein [Staphylococcus edaphicus]|uniref:Poly-gamma-glutamate hydrolase family protein n=1 Tax=Staphylococcus edaphicus TaxID=1955013 RepID=A0A2C6U4E0_9STAP|nr:poly-gamma-glutamate hydrolase family protein [Staphylococcus edaphicus]PHK48742.1 hypothetical protein BTJ66_11945 [Staphylococcus edaphicus]UQW81667.1 poly-gamma-glutamate hydrolase family protein [Staphylococcus edaphicus]